MSRYFPHEQFAEDQPMPYTILASHVLHRGFQAGTVVTLAGGAGMVTFRSFRVGLGPAISAGWPVLQRSVGVGSLVGTGVAAVMLAGRMTGREKIEWQDRSWRLLQNERQVAVDDWSLVGTAAGLASTAVIRNGPLGWKAVIGRTALGNIVGTVGYTVWTYGIQRKPWSSS